MLEIALFLEKNWKNRRSVDGGSTPKPPMASSGWGLRSQTPKLLLPSFVPITLKLRPIISY